MRKITPVERGVLLALMAEGRPLREATDLKARFNINMVASHRTNLTALRLIRTTPNPFKHELTDQGWQWAANELTATVPPGVLGLGQLYAVLDGIDRALQARNIDLRAFFARDAKPGESDDTIARFAWQLADDALARALQNSAAFEQAVGQAGEIDSTVRDNGTELLPSAPQQVRQQVMRIM
jgi:hypothetical protein